MGDQKLREDAQLYLLKETMHASNGYFQRGYAFRAITNIPI